MIGDVLGEQSSFGTDEDFLKRFSQVVSDLFLYPQKSGRCPIKRRFFNSLDTKGEIFV